MKRREFITLLGGAAALAARGAGAAGGADAAHRRAHEHWPQTIRKGRPASRRSRRGLQQLGWTDGRNLRIDYRWAAARCRPHPQIRGGIGRARAGRHPGHRQRSVAAVATGDPHRADRVRAGHRSGRCRLRREPGAAGRQRHRFHPLRIWHQREMAGAAQRDRAARDTSGGPSRSRPLPPGSASWAPSSPWRHRSAVELRPVDVRDAGEIERAITAFARAPNGGLIVPSGSASARSSQADHHARGAAPIARGLLDPRASSPVAA